MKEWIPKGTAWLSKFHLSANYSLSFMYLWAQRISKLLEYDLSLGPSAAKVHIDTKFKEDNELCENELAFFGANIPRWCK